MKKTLCLLLALCLMTVCLFGCSSNSGTAQPQPTETTAKAQVETTAAPEVTEPESTSVTVTDVLGRTITLDTAASSIVAIGANSLRIACYLDAADMIVGIESFELTPSIYRPYSVAYPDLVNKPVVAEAMGAADVEALILAKPDVIFCAYTDPADADTLQEQTGIPVISVRYSMGVFGEDFFNAMRIMGAAIGHDAEAEALIATINSYMNDLDERTSDIPDDQKPAVYVAGENFNGWHGIDGTNSAFVPLDAIHANNVAKTEEKASAYLVDMEQILVWNPDIIVLNYENLGLVNDQYNSDPSFFHSLQAVQNDQVYKILPYVWYGTNAEMGIIDAYYLGTILYPEAFSDINLEKKTNEIFQAFLNCDLYAQCETELGGFGTVTIGE